MLFLFFILLILIFIIMMFVTGNKIDALAYTTVIGVGLFFFFRLVIRVIRQEVASHKIRVMKFHLAGLSERKFVNDYIDGLIPEKAKEILHEDLERIIGECVDGSYGGKYRIPDKKKNTHRIYFSTDLENDLDFWVKHLLFAKNGYMQPDILLGGFPISDIRENELWNYEFCKAIQKALKENNVYVNMHIWSRTYKLSQYIHEPNKYVLISPVKEKKFKEFVIEMDDERR